jgi:hypothetical protein
MTDVLRTYGMFPARLLLVTFGIGMTLLMSAFGSSWREEWDAMDIRGYLLKGRNWNSAGF